MPEEILDLPESAIITDLDPQETSMRAYAQNYYNLRIYTAEQAIRYIHENRLYPKPGEPAGRWHEFLAGLLSDVDASRSQEASCGI